MWLLLVLATVGAALVWWGDTVPRFLVRSPERGETHA
jgi:hypothetical protein